MVYIDQDIYERVKEFAEQKGFKIRPLATKLLELALDEVEKRPSLVV